MAEEHLNSRREFMRSAGRYVILGGISALTLSTACRKQGKCTGQFVCRGCRQLEDCDLPQAVDVRTKRGENHV
jgi:hypothetical protein